MQCVSELWFVPKEDYMELGQARSLAVGHTRCGELSQVRDAAKTGHEPMIQDPENSTQFTVSGRIP